MYRTFKVDGDMLTEVACVYMTAQEHSEYLDWKQGKDSLKKAQEIFDDPVVKTVKKRKGNGSKHTAHAKPHNGVYRNGNSYVSHERMTEVLDVMAVAKDVDEAAEILRVKPGTVQAYRSIARLNGLL